MIRKFSMPKDFNVEVKTTYKGNKVNDEFLIKNPPIAVLYPTKKEVQDKYMELKKETKKNMFSILEVTEDGIIKHKNIKPL